MQTPFFFNEVAITTEDKDLGDTGVTEVHTSGIDTVKDTVRYAVRELGIGKRCHGEPWFVSSFHREDRDYFEKGIEKYYTLHFPRLSPRALLRVDQMIDILHRRTPDVL